MDEKFKIKAYISCENGCAWKEGEYNLDIETIGPTSFDYFNLVDESIMEWVANNFSTLKCEVTYSLILEYEMDHDGITISAEYFTVISIENTPWG